MKRWMTGLAVLLLVATGLFAAQGHTDIETNTATTIYVGPFYDGTDHETPELSLTVADIDCELVWYNEGTPTLIELSLTASGGDNDMTLITGSENGWYQVELTAAQVNYLGDGHISFRDPNNTFDSFTWGLTAKPANVRDSLLLGTDRLNANVYALDEDGTATEQSLLDLIDFADNGYDPTNNGVNVWTIRGEAPLGLSDVTTANAAALSNIYLDHLMANGLTDPNNVADNSVLAKLASATASWATFSSASDSLEAIANSIIPPPPSPDLTFTVVETSTPSMVTIQVGDVAIPANFWKDCLVRVDHTDWSAGAYSRVSYSTAQASGKVILYLSPTLPFTPSALSPDKVYIEAWGLRPADLPPRGPITY